MSAEAGVPEPDLVLYGTVSIDGVVQGAGGSTALEVRQGEDVLSLAVLPTAPDPLFVARIPIQSSQGGSAAGCLDFCLTLGGAAALWVTNPALPGGELEVALIELASRGRVVRQDIAVSTVAADQDIDGDGVPDFRDNCVNAAVGPGQLDSNGNGIGDACEGLDNPGLSYAAVGDVSNPADPATGKGTVDYEFEITTSEVTNADYLEFLNAVAASDPNGVYNELMAVDPRGGIVRDGEDGTYTYRVRPRMARTPVTFVSWLDAARYANWEANGRPSGPQGSVTTETGAFDLTVADPATSALLSETAAFSLPTEDEWYKAAYYDPTSGGSSYWLYPTRSDQAPVEALATPDGRVANPGSNVANHASSADWNGQDGNVTAASSAQAQSYYGGFDLGGNVDEWLADDAEPGASGLERIVRGGSFADVGASLASVAGSTNRQDVLRDPLVEDVHHGFRIVPEPASGPTLFVGASLLALLRRRRGRLVTGQWRAARSTHVAIGVFAVAAGLLAVVLGPMAASERDPAARDPLATAHPGSAATAIPAEPVVLARLDGHAVEEAEYRAFLDRVRARGYRPATMDEARRLLRVQLREKALELEAERRLSGEPANVEQVYRELLRDAAGAEGAPDGEVSRSPDRPLARARAREWSRVQREIVLERLLVRSRLEIDVDALRSFVDDRRAEGPQRPPVAFAPGAS